MLRTYQFSQLNISEKWCASLKSQLIKWNMVITDIYGLNTQGNQYYITNNHFSV